MYRKAFETALKLAFPEHKDGLKLEKRIKAVRNDCRLTKELAEWAHKIRSQGNDATLEKDPFPKDAAQTLDWKPSTRLGIADSYGVHSASEMLWKTENLIRPRCAGCIALPSIRNGAGVIAPTCALWEEINATVCEGLIIEGAISGHAMQTEKLISRDLT